MSKVCFVKRPWNKEMSGFESRIFPVIFNGPFIPVLACGFKRDKLLMLIKI